MTQLLNQPVRHLFRVVDLAATPITGLTTASFTLTLESGTPGSLTPASEEVTVLEEGNGYYWAAYTPTEGAGEYHLSVAHASHIVTPESFQATIVGPAAVTGPYLTTLDRVKLQLFPGEASPPSSHDALISALIAEADQKVRARLDDRRILEQAHVEYVDGTGLVRLPLREGPLVSVASVEFVEYSADDDGNRVETLTTVGSAKWAPRGERDAGHLGKGWLQRIAGVWVCGRRNYKVTYTAGFDVVPPILQQVATNAVLCEATQRPGLESITLGDYRAQFTDPRKLEDAIAKAVAPLQDWSLV